MTRFQHLAAVFTAASLLFLMGCAPDDSDEPTTGPTTSVETSTEPTTNTATTLPEVSAPTQIDPSDVPVVEDPPDTTPVVNPCAFLEGLPTMWWHQDPDKANWFFQFSWRPAPDRNACFITIIGDGEDSTFGGVFEDVPATGWPIVLGEPYYTLRSRMHIEFNLLKDGALEFTSYYYDGSLSSYPCPFRPERLH